MKRERVLAQFVFGFASTFAALSFADFANAPATALYAAIVQAAVLAALEWKNELERGRGKANALLLLLAPPAAALAATRGLTSAAASH